MAHSPANTEPGVTMSWQWSFCCGLLFVGALPSAIPAQGVPVAGTPQFHRLQMAVAEKRAMAIYADGRREEVRGARLDPDGVLRPAADSTGVLISALTAIKVRQSAAFRGARIGAIIGGLSFLAGGVAAAQEEGDYFSVGTGEVAVITLIGLGGGALTGALLGAPFNYWKTVYRAPAKAEPVVVLGGRGIRLGAGVSF